MEAPIGWIKRILGFRQFGLRGLHTVRGTINSPLWKGAGQYARVSHCISVLQSAPAKGAPAAAENWYRRSV